jgi:hypothetical protein
MNGVFYLKVELGNCAMRTRFDLATALDAIADRIREGETCGSVGDDNGNNVGSYYVEAE